MIRQIFNFLYNIYNKIINLIQLNNKFYILFIIIWIFLYNYGYITESRIIIFLIIIICICIYKIVYKKIQNRDYIYTENLLYIILWIDYIKLFIINMLIFCSIKIYELKMLYKDNKTINMVILLFENAITNPLKMILYKIYNGLYIWKTTPIFEILFKRIYGSILGILIFSNIIGYLWYLMNYSVLNVYILLILINCIDELVKNGKYKNIKIIEHLEYIKYLNLNKELLKIIEIRGNISIIALYIKKVLIKAKLWYGQNKIKTFAFIINNIYFITIYENINIKITNHQIELQHHKLYNWEILFQPFYYDIVACLNDYLRLLSTIEYLLIKIKSDSSILCKFSKNDVLNLQEFILLVVKLLLYFLWDFENLQIVKFSNLTICKFSYELEYTSINEVLIINYLNYHKLNNNKFFELNNKFFEQFYLYGKIISNYDLNNNKMISSKIINFENYNHIEVYARKILNQLLLFNSIYEIDIELCRVNETDITIEPTILKKLNEYREQFIEEWKASKVIDIELANIKRLQHINKYVESINKYS